MVVSPKVSTITVGGVDITTSISNYSESGGTKKYGMVTGFGNKKEVAQIGADDWIVKFDIKLDDDTLYTIFESGPAEIIVTLNEELEVGAMGTLLTITYSNALPQSLSAGMSADNYFKGSIEFLVPYYSETGTENKSVI